jgi:hypothetical protein
MLPVQTRRVPRRPITLRAPTRLMKRGRKRGMTPPIMIITAPAPANMAREAENMPPANMDIPRPGTPPITTAKIFMADTAFLRLAFMEALDATISSASDIR